MRAGDRVTWTNRDSVQHTTTSDAGLWDSDILDPGQTFSFRFNQAGSYPYSCLIHPFIHGRVEVSPAPASATPTRTPALSPTPTRPPAGTATPTAPPGGGAVGRSLSLTYLGGRQTLLTWQDGAGQPFVVRVFTDGVVPIRPASSTSHVDTVPAGVLQACSVVVAVGPDGRPPAVSDLLCVMPGTATGFPPRNFTLQLNQSPVAILTWERASGATAYVLLPVGTERVQLLPSTAMGATDQTGGDVTCYVLVAQFGSQASGISAVLCAIPGFARDLGAGQRLPLPEVRRAP